MRTDRRLVIELLLRRNYANKLLKNYKGDCEIYRTMLIAHWAEAHNAAETARRIYYGHEL